MKTFCSKHEQTFESTVESTVIRDVLTLMWRHCGQSGYTTTHAVVFLPKICITRSMQQNVIGNSNFKYTESKVTPWTKSIPNHKNTGILLWFVRIYSAGTKYSTYISFSVKQYSLHNLWLLLTAILWNVLYIFSKNLSDCRLVTMSQIFIHSFFVQNKCLSFSSTFSTHHPVRWCVEKVDENDKHMCNRTWQMTFSIAFLRYIK